MALIRGHHNVDDQFTQIPNAWLRDKRISLAAIGLMAQLMSHRPGWEITQENLAHANGCGRDRIRTVIDELLSAGYLKRSESRQRNSAGQLAGYDYVTCDPTLDSPMLGFPTQAEPTLGEPTLDKPLHKKNISREEHPEEEHSEETSSSNDSDLSKAFNDFWEIYPRKMGKGEAKAAFVKAVNRFGHEVILDGVRALAADPNLPAPQFVPRAATWLNQERWDDEPYPVPDPASISGVQRGVAKSPHVGGPREWVQDMHDLGEHWECRPGEFGCK